jgi:hypothetical protein
LAQGLCRIAGHDTATKNDKVIGLHGVTLLSKRRICP